MLLLVGVVLLAGYSVSTPAQDTRIVGGEDVDITDVPYQVSLLNRGRHSCGGAIVANDLVITAAHCIMGLRPSELQIRAGSSSSLTGGELYRVGDYVYHSNFTFSKMDCDVGLIWLARPLEFSDRVAPINLYEQGVEIEGGEEAFVTGWGNLREGGGVPKTLQIVSIPIVSDAVCSYAYSPFYKITESMLCAGVPEGGKDACQGDSGGPLVHDGKLAGVVSWGIGCARPNYPGVYAKVSALRSWLDNQADYLRLKHLFRN